MRCIIPHCFHADPSKRNASSLAFAIESLRVAGFAKSTITPRTNSFKALRSTDEIGSNALWRFLHLRNYIGADHTLTPLGHCLSEAYKTGSTTHLQPSEYEEPALLAIELLRLGLLNADNMFPVPPYHGAPYRGTEEDQRNTLLVSRVACLGRLRHKSIGYTGPLSRHLLAYRSIVSAVRDTQRDTLEMALCTLLLSGNADRSAVFVPGSESDASNSGSATALQRTALTSLPFLRDTDCALGIAVKHYLDELSAPSDDEKPTNHNDTTNNSNSTSTNGTSTSNGTISASTRASIRDLGARTWFPHAVDFASDLDRAFASVSYTHLTLPTIYSV